MGNFKLPVIVPCVLYNGRDNWTVCRSFRETVEPGDLFGEYVLDFKYILFDVERYDENDLMKLSNVIGSVFLLDQKVDYEELIVRMHKVIQVIKKLNRTDQQIFMEWVQNVLVSSLPKKRAEELKDAVEQRMRGKEDEDMVYALGEAVKNEFLKYEKKLKEASEQGIEKGIEKAKHRSDYKSCGKGI